MSLALRRQVTFFVTNGGGHLRLVVWTQWDTTARARSELVVWQVVPTLLPRDRIAHRVERRVDDVALDDLEAWLASAGYVVISRLDSPTVEEPLRG